MSGNGKPVCKLFDSAVYKSFGNAEHKPFDSAVRSDMFGSGKLVGIFVADNIDDNDTEFAAPNYLKSKHGLNLWFCRRHFLMPGRLSQFPAKLRQE